MPAAVHLNGSAELDLRASRQRLVAAQDDERRRLERNLHGGDLAITSAPGRGTQLRGSLPVSRVGALA